MVTMCLFFGDVYTLPRGILEKMHRLPLNDLFGERIRHGSQKLGNHLWELYSACPRAANLTDNEMRYLVQILRAMPNATVVSSDVLNVNMIPTDANWGQQVTPQPYLPADWVDTEVEPPNVASASVVGRHPYVLSLLNQSQARQAGHLDLRYYFPSLNASQGGMCCTIGTSGF